MNKERIFYTSDHEWIRFSDNGVYVGLSAFKLTGIHKVEDIRILVSVKNDLIVQGMPMLHLVYKDYVIVAHAPVDCRVVAMNGSFMEGQWEDIVNEPEGKGWLFKIVPISVENNHLIHREIYKERLLSRFEKIN